MLYVFFTYSRNELTLVEKLRIRGIKAYCPRRICAERKRGEWVYIEKIIFGSYVFVEAENITAEMYYTIKSCDESTQLLSFEPLPKNEEEYISALCNDNNGCIDISRGYILNGKLHITDGFLKSIEHKIIKYNRRGKRVTAEVTLYGEKLKLVLSVEFDPPPRDKLRYGETYQRERPSE